MNWHLWTNEIVPTNINDREWCSCPPNLPKNNEEGESKKWFVWNQLWPRGYPTGISRAFAALPLTVQPPPKTFPTSTCSHSHSTHTIRQHQTMPSHPSMSCHLIHPCHLIPLHHITFGQISYQQSCRSWSLIPASVWNH